MAESAAYTRRGYQGGASLARIPGGLNAGVTGVVAADDLSSWSGATTNGPIRVMVNRLGSTPEEIEVSSVSGNNITISARGVGDTTEATHDPNATIEIVSSPRDFDEANYAVTQTVGKVTTAGDIIVATAANTFARLARGSAYQALIMNSGGSTLQYAASLQSLLTTQGDIAYASSANTPARLAKGTAGQTLRMNAGATAPEWGAAVLGAVGSANVTTAESTSSTSLTSLSTVQSVSITTGTRALVLMGAEPYTASPTARADMNFSVSGATTRSAQTVERASAELVTANRFIPLFRAVIVPNLTAGVNVFLAQFASADGVEMNFQNRLFQVFDLGSTL